MNTRQPVEEPDFRRWVDAGRRFLRRARRQWRAALAIVLLAALAAFEAPALFPPVFVSEAVLVYRELVPAATLTDRDTPGETPRQRGARLREMVLARPNLERLIRQHELYGDMVSSRGLAVAVDRMLEDASCTVGDDTFAIRFEYPDADLVERVTAELAASLIEASASYRLEMTAAAKRFLETQRDRTKKELHAKEQALAMFLADHPEFAQDVMFQGGLSPAGASIRAQERKAASASPAFNALERQRARLLNRIDAIKTAKEAIPPPAANKPEPHPELARAIAQARRELDDAERQLADLAARYTNVHPDVRRARGRRNDAATALALAEVALERAQEEAPASLSTAPATEGDRRLLQSQLARVEAGLAAARRRRDQGAPDAGSGWIVELETEWAALNRDVLDVRERDQQIERHLFQASILDHMENSGGAAQMTVVDPAYRPERPARRGRYRTGAAAALVVLALGGLVLLSLVRLDDRLYDLEDLERLRLDGVVQAVPRMVPEARHG